MYRLSFAVGMLPAIAPISDHIHPPHGAFCFHPAVDRAPHRFPLSAGKLHEFLLHLHLRGHSTRSCFLEGLLAVHVSRHFRQLGFESVAHYALRYFGRSYFETQHALRDAARASSRSTRFESHGRYTSCHFAARPSTRTKSVGRNCEPSSPWRRRRLNGNGWISRRSIHSGSFATRSARRPPSEPIPMMRPPPPARQFAFPAGIRARSPRGSTLRVRVNPGNTRG